MTEPFGICKVRFLDKNQEPSQREYSYFVSEEVFKKIVEKVCEYNIGTLCASKIPSFCFVNEEGYNYRGSRVIPVRLYDTSAVEFEELKREVSRWIQTICWDGQIFLNKGVNFSAKYSLKDSKVAAAFSSVADNAKQVSDAFSSVANCTKQYSDTSNSLYISSNDLSSSSTSGNCITMDNNGITFSNPIKSIRVGGTEYQIQDDTSNIKQELKETKQLIENLKKEIKEKENPSMFNNIMKNVKFGAVSSTEVRMSIYGPAFNTKDGWLAWSERDNTYLDVSDMLLDMDNFCYMAPVAKKDVKPGDFIYHHNSWLRVINQREDGRVVAEVILNQTETTLIPTKNVFGFDFYTKLISFGSNMFNASPDTPFGNMLPLLMMNKSDDSTLPMLMMMNGGTMGNMSFDMSNPMFLYLMMNKGDSNTRDMLMVMAMMQNNAAAPCACGCHHNHVDDGE